MEIVEDKKLLIENKKKDLSEEFLKQGLGSLFIAVNDVYERIQSGLKKIVLLDDLDDLYRHLDSDVVMIDISNRSYNADLDNIAYAKRMNENLCVIVNDILIEEYQMYLYNMYNIDGVIFDVKHIKEKDLENVVNIAGIMGIELIFSVDSYDDIKKVERYPDTSRIVMVKSSDILKYIPEGVSVIKDVSLNLDKKHSYISIVKEEKNE